MTPRTVKEHHENIQNKIVFIVITRGGGYDDTGGAPAELHRRAKARATQGKKRKTNNKKEQFSSLKIET